MTRALVWKELREQWVVWLALAVLAVGGVAAAYALLSPNHYRDEMLVGILWLTAWGYGLVSGSLLFAGETEEGTQTFLDVLPGTRRRVWRTKVGAGLGLLAALAVVLGLVDALLLPPVRSLPRTIVEVAGLVLYGVMGYAWGLYSGSRSATVLGAIARGAAAQVLLAASMFPFIVLVLQFLLGDHAGGAELLAITVMLALTTAWPAVRSRLIYCETDWQRVPLPLPQPTGPVRRSWGEAFRLASRESRGLALGMAVFGLVGTLAVTALGVVAWPVATVLIGVLCGVTALSPERQGTAGRTLVARTVVRLAIAVFATVLTAIVPLLLLVTAVELNDRPQLADAETQLLFGAAADFLKSPVLFLFLWLIEGLSVGLFWGSCIRRPLVACLVAVPCALLLGALWLPEVFLGETPHAWQVWGTPAVLLVAACVLMRPRAAGKTSALRTVGVAACGVLLAAVCSGAALWYRAAEITSPPFASDIEAYRASLSDARDNEGGRLTAAALSRVQEVAFGPLAEDSRQSRLRRFGPPPDALYLLSRARSVADSGWEGTFIEWNSDVNARHFRVYFDGLFRDEWARNLAEAAKQPTGIVVDPRGVALDSPLPEPDAARGAAILLVARGLQRQKDGDPGEFVHHLRTGLALVRSLRHRTVSEALVASSAVEKQLARGVELWLDALEGRPDLLRQVLDVLGEHDRSPRADLEDARKADFLVALNAIADPGKLLTEEEARSRPRSIVHDIRISPFHEFLSQTDRSELFARLTDLPFPAGLHAWSGAPADGELIRWSLRAPWERIRLRRMLEQAETRVASGGLWNQIRFHELMEQEALPFPPRMQTAARAPSQLERITDLVAAFLSEAASRRRSLNGTQNPCGEAEKLVAHRLIQVEAGRPPERRSGKRN